MSPDFHHNRKYLLDHVFVFHPAMRDYVCHKYQSELAGIQELVSIHVQFERFDGVVQAKEQPSLLWYTEAITRYFSPPGRYKFLFFTDNVHNLTQWLNQADMELPYTAIINEETDGVPLLLMTLCRHHVLSNSDISFWGAYLDPLQPSVGRTVVPGMYLKSRELSKLPFEQWLVPLDHHGEYWLDSRTFVDMHMTRWRALPSRSPPNIMTEQELSDMKAFYSPVLFGSFAMNLFQISATCAIALEAGVECVIAHWDQQAPRGAMYLPYGGGPPPAPGITLKHIFPNLRFVGFNPSFRDVIKSAYRQSKPFAYREVKLPKKTTYVHGWFFYYGCLILFLLHCRLYAHILIDTREHRGYLMSKLFKFHPEMIQHVVRKYGSLLDVSEAENAKTVSVHFRFGSVEIPHVPLPQPSVEWYRQVIESNFGGNFGGTFLLFSDNVSELRQLLQTSRLMGERSHLVIEEDYAQTLYMTTLCRHHVLANSKLSYWGAFLDLRQPRGVTVVPKQFLESHPIKRLPFDEWRLV